MSMEPCHCATCGCAFWGEYIGRVKLTGEAVYERSDGKRIVPDAEIVRCDDCDPRPGRFSERYKGAAR